MTAMSSERYSSAKSFSEAGRAPGMRQQTSTVPWSVSRVDQRLTKPLEVGKIAVNDKRFRRVAHRRALRFRVYHDPLCHFGIGARIDEDVAVSDTRFNHGDGGVLDHA